MKFGFPFKALLGVIGFVALVLLGTFWSRFTPFYKDCMRIREGMSEKEVENLMKAYEGNARFFFSRESADGPGLYYESNSSGDQCYMKIEGGVVARFMPRFEP